MDKEQGLVTLETDKAAMDVPSPYAGTVKEMKVKKGDKASEGSLVAHSGSSGNCNRSQTGSFCPYPNPGNCSQRCPTSCIHTVAAASGEG